ncbi:DUF6542 domain-containing protein [Nocardioides coralli]|uniref:DUF6542 domain-containing protein n=1 Tax=Nocardioides coralli TaxID=2872154 RepID=UPI001CA41363|nr:DUF6542 domain-containing protein [Nocardioides coralli]QZY28502.1 hypothetical protein K6T13_13665 [Nocardioides coralli]
MSQQSGPRTLWEQGHEPGRQMVALGAAVTLSVVALDLAVGEGLGLLFDLGFVVTCIAIALLVRPRDFFAVGVLPPLLMLGVLVLVEIARPGLLGTHPDDGAIQSVVTGLAHHSGALVTGYLVCLAVLAVRHRFVAQATKRPGSPEPTRTTSG